MKPRSSSDRTTPTAFAPNGPRRSFVCSQSQKRFWFEEQIQPGNPALNVAVRWRLEGDVSHPHLAEAWQLLVARHETLRTFFESEDGDPRQVVEPGVSLHIPIVDLTTLPEKDAFEEAERISIIEAHKPFDLSRAPLFRVTLVRVRERLAFLLFTAHHIVVDGWSVGVLAREMGTFCAALQTGRSATLSPLEATYADFAEWEQSWLGDVLERGGERATLERRLHGFRRLDISTDMPRPAIPTSHSEIASRLLDRRLSDALIELGRANGCTLFMTSFAALLVLLHRHTGEEDVCIGTQVAGRDDPAFENMVGTFVNTIPLRTDLSGNPRFLDLLERARDAVTEALEQRHVPLERVVEIINPKRDFTKNSLFSVNFIFQRSFIKNETYGSFKLVDIPSRSAGPMYELNFFMVERVEGWRVSCEYNCDLFRSETVETLLARFTFLLTQLAADPMQRVSDVPLKGVEDRAKVAALGRESRAFGQRTEAAPELSAGRAASAAEIYRNATEVKVAATLSDLLGRSAIERDADIFALGFHSLLALRFVVRIKEAFGVQLQLRELFERATIRSVAEYIDWLSAPPGKSLDDALEASQAVEVESPVLTLNAGGRRRPFFYLHSDLFGGGIYCRRLATAIGPEQPIHAVAPHGTAGLPQLGTIESMALGYLPYIRALQPSGPYRLGGFCVSGLVAYEIARLLRAQGETIERLALVNASPLPKRSIPLLDRFVRTIASNRRLSPRLREKLCYNLARFHLVAARGPGVILKLLRYALRRTRFRPNHEDIRPVEGVAPSVEMPEPEESQSSFSHVAVGAWYHPKPYDGEVTLVWAEDQDVVDDEPTYGWGEVAASVRIVPIAGGHIAGLNERIDELAAAMREALRD